MERAAPAGVAELDPHGTVAELARALLAAKGRLRGEDARLVCRPLVRGDAVCGLYFALSGPRRVLLTAVWDASGGVLWCYDSRGERFMQAQAPPQCGAESV